MSDDRVPVERVQFAEYGPRIEAILTEYHESVADGFDRWLRRRDDGDTDHDETSGVEFSTEAYADGELEKDLAYLEREGSREPLVVALDGDGVVGCVYLYRLSADEGEVKRLYVREEYRNLGLGRALMERLVDAVVESGYTTLRLDTAPFMRSATVLYRDLDFEPFDGGESISDIPTPILDEITYMRLDLCDDA